MSIHSREASSSHWEGLLPNDLALYRNRKGWGQRQAALELGIPRNRLSLWEGGKGLPPLAVLERIASAYGVSVSQLYAPPILSLIGQLSATAHGATE